MTPRQSTILAAATERPDHASALADLATLLLASDGGDVTPAEVKGALERSLTGMLDVRERAWKAAR